MRSKGAATPDRLFESHRGDVYAWAYHLLGSHHDALDTVQDVFLRWFEQSRRAVPDRPRPWLRRTTINRAIDLLRARKRKTEPLAEDREPRARSEAPDPLRNMQQNELRAQVAEALSRLSEAQRTVLLAREFDEQTFQGISEELGIAVSTVKTHYVRALRHLKNTLGPRWDEKRSS